MDGISRQPVSIRLIVEVMERRPPMDDDLFSLLLVLAEDARDETRVGIPGMELLTRRCQKSPRTINRRLERLAAMDVIRVIRRSAPGRRAEYMIMPLSRTDASMVAHVPDSVDNQDAEPVDNHVTDASMVAHVREPERTPQTAERTPRSMARPPSVLPQPYTDPPQMADVEGARDPAAVDNPDIGHSGDAAAAARPAGLTDGQWKEIAWLASAQKQILEEGNHRA